ncbi:MAG TPA: tetratricopeptide repeat protein [Actinocrinis sp.]|nr:tetratricopeptide repeat protein [Actinocrinis sp.]
MAQTTDFVVEFDHWSKPVPRAQRLCTLLAEHPGQWIPVGAAAAAGDLTAGKAMRLLDGLVRADVLERDGDRYRFLAPRPTSEADRKSVDRMLSWYLHGAREASRAMGVDSWRGQLPDPAWGVQVPEFTTFAAGRLWLDANRDALLDAVRSAAATGRDQMAWQLAAVLTGAQSTWHDYQPWAECTRLGRQAAERCGDETGVALMLESEGKALMQAGSIAQGLAALERTLVLREEIGDRSGMVRSHNAIGVARLHTDQLDLAMEQFRLTIDLAGQIGDEYFLAIGQMNLGAALARSGDPALGEGYLRAAANDLREQRRPVFEAAAWSDLGRALRDLGDLNGAEEAGRRAVDLAGETGAQVFLADCLVQFAVTLAAIEHRAWAINALREAASINNAAGRSHRHAQILDLAADLYRSQGMDQSADAAHRTAAGLRARTATGPSPDLC